MTIYLREAEEIDAERGRAAEEKWWRLHVDDGTVPGEIKVYMTHDAFAGLRNYTDDPEHWMIRAVNDKVSDIAAVDQLAVLRAMSPIELLVAS